MNTINPHTFTKENPEFHLTGSRFFDTYTQYSDWDFVTDDISKFEEVKQKYKGEFLVTNYNNNKFDNQTLSIYVLIANNGTPVHIILVRDILIKLKAQNILLKFNEPIPKIGAKLIWNLAYTLAEIHTEIGK